MLSSAPRLLVFDLDGTLVDSRQDLANAVNATLKHFDKAALPDEVISGYIGDGVSALVRRSLGHAHLIADEPDPHDDAFVDRAVRFFLDFYRVHKLDFTRPYPGVIEALTTIRARHPALPMAVLTNKPVGPSQSICDGLGLSGFFFRNYGGDSFRTKKPDPEGLLHLISEASHLDQGKSPITPAETFMIGDSHVDIETARACGARSVGCLYGLSPTTLAAARPQLTVESAEQWPAVLNLN